MSRKRLPENEGLPPGVSRQRYKARIAEQKPFIAQVRISGVQYYLGSFDTVERAEQAIETKRALLAEVVTPSKRIPENEGLPTGVSRQRYKARIAKQKPFYAQVQINGRAYYLGSFDTVEQAERAIKTKRAVLAHEDPRIDF